jgi:hypothetical protein
MPLKTSDGDVVFSMSLETDTREAVRVAIARTVLFSEHHLSNRYLDCPFEKEKQRLLYKAGFEDALKGLKNPNGYFTIGAHALEDYVDSEDAIQREYGKHWAKMLCKAASGNPHSQVQSDIVTLADRKKWQSIGHTDVCPVTAKPFVVATGFRQVPDKSNATCAADMEEQAKRFFGKKQLDVAHSIVTDVGAFGISQDLIKDYPFGTQLHRTKCMMHQTSKVVSFGAGNYGYKDGHGGALHECPSLDDFNADFKTMEMWFRRDDNACALSAQAKKMKGPDLRCRSNFNTTRCAAEMHQHTWAIRMNASIRKLALTEPTKALHDFQGHRWQELNEIQAIEQLTGSLTMKCQMENVATAGYWYYWLDKAFGTLAGRLPLEIVDMDNIEPSPRLATVPRNPESFRSLSQIVRGRHQVEFKRRYGLLGDKTGLDVDINWRPTMTPAFGLPILLDPRLNNTPSKLGLDEAHQKEYEALLHGLHYQWYLRARARSAKEAERVHQLQVLQANADAKKEASSSDEKDLLNKEDVDMGWDGDSDVEEIAPKTPATRPEIDPIIHEAAFHAASVDQFVNYKLACRKNIAWKLLFPDPKYQVGWKGSFWQEKLYDVHLGPIWDVLDKLNVDGKFGFFCELAKHSWANVYKLQASSFVERVNSAGKIVFNEKNLKLKPDKVEKRVLLRMNRKWVAHMKSTFPDMSADILGLLRGSHDALNAGYNSDFTPGV